MPVVRGELAFEGGGATDDGQPSTIDIDLPVATANRSGRLIAGIAAMPSEWAIDSHPAATKDDAKQGAVKVGFGRIGRDNVSKLMPKLLSGTAPLRAMMDQRS